MADVNRKKVYGGLYITNKPAHLRNNTNACAILEIDDDNGGVLIPRMTSVQRDAINDPCPGLIIYNTTNSALEVFNNGMSWTTTGAGGGTGDPVTGVAFNDATNVLTITLQSGATQTTTIDNDGSSLSTVSYDGVTGQATFTLSDASTVVGDFTFIRDDINDVRTALGIIDGDTDLGTFPGSTIIDNTTVKNALQLLEAAIEAASTAKIVANVPARDALTGLVAGDEVWVVSGNDPTKPDQYRVTAVTNGAWGTSTVVRTNGVSTDANNVLSVGNDNVPFYAGTNAVFLTASALGATIPSKPTVAEIQAYAAANSIVDSVVEFNGTDTDNDAPTNTYFVSATGTTVPLGTAAKDFLFLSDSAMGAAIQTSPTLVEIGAAFGAERGVYGYYNATDTASNPATHIYFIDNDGTVFIFKEPAGLPNDRAFAPASDVTVALIGKPTDVEINTWNNSLPTKLADTIIRYTGSDVEVDPATYIFHVDGSSNVTLLRSPVDEAAQDRVFLAEATVVPTIPGSPTLTEIKAVTDANMYFDTIVYYTATDTATDAEELIYHVDKDGDVTLITDVKELTALRTLSGTLPGAVDFGTFTDLSDNETLLTLLGEIDTRLTFEGYRYDGTSGASYNFDNAPTQGTSYFNTILESTPITNGPSPYDAIGHTGRRWIVRWTPIGLSTTTAGTLEAFAIDPTTRAVDMFVRGRNGSAWGAWTQTSNPTLPKREQQDTLVNAVAANYVIGDIVYIDEYLSWFKHNGGVAGDLTDFDFIKVDGTKTVAVYSINAGSTVPDAAVWPHANATLDSGSIAHFGVDATNFAQCQQFTGATLNGLKADITFATDTTITITADGFAYQNGDKIEITSLEPLTAIN